LSDTFKGITNPFGIGHLVQGCRPFSAVASSAAGMFRVAFESADAQRFFIDETKKTTGSFTVKTNGRDDLIVLLYFSRPMGRIVFDPIVPFFHGWITGQSVGCFESQSRWMKRLPGFRHS